MTRSIREMNRPTYPATVLYFTIDANGNRVAVTR